MNMNMHNKFSNQHHKNQNLNSYEGGQIDLHGYTKSEAIDKLTWYIEKEQQQMMMVQSKKSKSRCSTFASSNKEICCWNILVITGSGAHSNQGPVLRNAIQNLLDKRQMQYTTNHGRGSFTVNINSGHKLYPSDPMPSDTKVIIQQQNEGDGGLPPRGYGEKKTHINTGWNPNRPNTTISDYDPTLGEIAVNEAQFAESKSLHEMEQKLDSKEGRLLKRAMSESLLDETKYVKQEEEEENMMKRALSLSMLDTSQQQQYNDDDDDDLLKALELSKTEINLKKADDDDDDLLKALELSKTEINNLKKSDDDDDDDYDLEKVLALSIQEQQRQRQRQRQRQQILSGDGKGNNNGDDGENTTTTDDGDGTESKLEYWRN